MHVWLIHLGELLPIDGNPRLFRYGVLGEMLSESGHRVTRWSTQRKRTVRSQIAESTLTITTASSCFMPLVTGVTLGRAGCYFTDEWSRHFAVGPRRSIVRMLSFARCLPLKCALPQWSTENARVSRSCWTSVIFGLTCSSI